MKKHMNDKDFIAAYFNNELNDTQKIEFLHRYEEDETFQQQVDEYKIMHDTFSNLSEHAVNRIESILQKDEQQKVRHLFTKKTWSIAASVLLLVGISAVVYLTIPEDKNPVQVTEKPEIQETQPEKQLILPLYSPEDALGYTPAESSVTDSILTLVYKAEKNQNTYSFKDTLKLYVVDKTIQPVSLVQINGRYILETTDESYELFKGFNQEMELERYEDANEH